MTTALTIPFPFEHENLDASIICLPIGKYKDDPEIP